MEVRVTGTDTRDTMLSHQHRCVKIMDQVATNIR